MLSSLNCYHLFFVNITALLSLPYHLYLTVICNFLSSLPHYHPCLIIIPVSLSSLPCYHLCLKQLLLYLWLKRTSVLTSSEFEFLVSAVQAMGHNTGADRRRREIWCPWTACTDGCQGHSLHNPLCPSPGHFRYSEGNAIEKFSWLIINVASSYKKHASHE